MLIYDGASKNISCIIQSHLNFWKFWCVLSFKSIISSLRKSRMENTSMGVGLIKLVDPSDTLNYICCLYLCGTKSVVQKTDPRLALVCFGVIFGVIVLKVMCFCCYLCNIIGNQGFFSYRIYDLLRIAIKQSSKKCSPIYISYTK